MPRSSRTRPQPPELDSADKRVLRRFRVVFNAVRTHFQQVEKSAGLGGAQVWALSVVRDCPGIRVTELAKAMDIHQSTASNLVRALVRGNCLSTTRNAVDKRVVELTLTPAGMQVLESAPGPYSGVLPDALARLDAATLDRLEGDLNRLIQLLGADEQAAGIPLAEL